MGKKIIFTILIFFIILMSLSCIESKKDEEKDPYENLGELKIIPNYDTLFMTVLDAPISISLKGAFIDESKNSSSNSGVIQEIEFKSNTFDTTFQIVPIKDAEWSSSNPAIADINNGMITAKSKGLARITAKINNIKSSPVNVVVSSVDNAPGLSLDPPDSTLVFQNYAKVSGTVQIIGTSPNFTKLSIFETTSGYKNLNYDNEGRFSENVQGLTPGLNEISIIAQHPENSALITIKKKNIYYRPFDTNQLDTTIPSNKTLIATSIVGKWKGSTVGKVFYFNIVENMSSQKYDIIGTIDIEYEDLWLTKNIKISGLINLDGSIDASLSLLFNDVSVSGYFIGQFTNTGYCDGEYSSTYEKFLWPKLGFKEKWTAVKIE